MRGVIQLMLSCMANVWNSSILGNFCTSILIPSGLSTASDDACLATSSASINSLEIAQILLVLDLWQSGSSTLSTSASSVLLLHNPLWFARLLTWSHFLRVPFWLPWTWLIWAQSILLHILALLLMVGNCSWTPYFKASPSGEVIYFTIKLSWQFGKEHV